MRLTPQPVAGRTGDDGFTLVELLITLVILPLVLGAMAVLLLTVFANQDSVSTQLSDASDSQIVSAVFVPDVQSAAALTTQATSSPQCGTTGTQILGLEWTSSAGVSEVASYDKVASAKSTTDTLYRDACNDVNGTLSLYSSVPIAYDVPATQGPATISCSSSATTCAYANGWLATTNVSSVTLSFTTVNGSLAFQLAASPRDSSQSSLGGVGISPMVVLGSSSCTTPALSVSGGGSVTVNGGNSPLLVATSCAASVQWSHDTIALKASAIETGDSALNAYSGTGGSPSTGPPEDFVPNQLDPLSLLVAPSNPSTTASGSCSGTPMVCTPGDYATSPPFTAITVASFSPSNGTYVFEQPLSITNSMNITFGGGTYWFKGGLSVVGDASVSFGTGTYIFGNSASDTCASSTCLSVSNSGSITSGSSQVLLYNEAGAVTLSGAGAVALTGTSADAGVAIWDASAQGTTYPLTLANSASSTAGYGGVFVPNGEVLLSGAAPVSMSFLITEYANVSGSGAFNLG